MANTVIIIGATQPESLESSYARAFGALGWQVKLWNPQAALRRCARGGKLGVIFGTFVHVEVWHRKASFELFGLVEQLRPDLILVVGTTGVRAGTLAQIKVRQPGCPIYCIYPDTPNNLDTDRIHCLPFFDRVTVSSPPWSDAMRKLGAARTFYLPFAADTEFHRPAPVRMPAQNLAFIGSWRFEREEFLEPLVEFGLRIWGGDYWRTRTRKGSPLRTCWTGRSASGADFAEVCATSRILLNIMDPLTWPGPNMRTFEQAACRGFTLMTRSPAVLELFAEGKTIACFDSAAEAKDKIKYFLAHEEESRRIAAASHEFVTTAGHTYLDRAKQLREWAREDRR